MQFFYEALLRSIATQYIPCFDTPGQTIWMVDIRACKSLFLRHKDPTAPKKHSLQQMVYGSIVTGVTLATLL
jgi:hypothetical protein